MKNNEKLSNIYEACLWYNQCGGVDEYCEGCGDYYSPVCDEMCDECVERIVEAGRVEYRREWERYVGEYDNGGGKL